MSDPDLEVQYDVKVARIPDAGDFSEGPRRVTGLDGRGRSSSKNSAKPCGATYPRSAEVTFGSTSANF